MADFALGQRASAPDSVGRSISGGRSRLNDTMERAYMSTSNGMRPSCLRHPESPPPNFSPSHTRPARRRLNQRFPPRPEVIAFAANSRSTHVANLALARRQHANPRADWGGSAPQRWTTGRGGETRSKWGVGLRVSCVRAPACGRGQSCRSQARKGERHGNLARMSMSLQGGRRGGSSAPRAWAHGRYLGELLCVGVQGRGAAAAWALSWQWGGGRCGISRPACWPHGGKRCVSRRAACVCVGAAPSPGWA